MTSQNTSQHMGKASSESRWHAEPREEELHIQPERRRTPPMRSCCLFFLLQRTSSIKEPKPRLGGLRNCGMSLFARFPWDLPDHLQTQKPEKSRTRKRWDPRFRTPKVKRSSTSPEKKSENQLFSRLSWLLLTFWVSGVRGSQTPLGRFFETFRGFGVFGSAHGRGDLNDASRVGMHAQSGIVSWKVHSGASTQRLLLSVGQLGFQSVKQRVKGGACHAMGKSAARTRLLPGTVWRRHSQFPWSSRPKGKEQGCWHCRAPIARSFLRSHKRRFKLHFGIAQSANRTFFSIRSRSLVAPRRQPSNKTCRTKGHLSVSVFIGILQSGHAYKLKATGAVIVVPGTGQHHAKDQLRHSIRVLSSLWWLSGHPNHHTFKQDMCHVMQIGRAFQSSWVQCTWEVVCHIDWGCC